MFELDRADFVVVDFQFCNGNDKNIYIKELSYMCGTSVVPNNFLFRPPFDGRKLTRAAYKTNMYCKKFINGLDWTDGNLDYSTVGDILSPLDNFKYIFVVGRAKKDFLTKYNKPNIINLENQMSLKNRTNYFTGCPNHYDLRYKCSLNNVFKIFIFIEQNFCTIENLIYNKIND